MDIVAANSFGSSGQKMASRPFRFRLSATGSSTFPATSRHHHGGGIQPRDTQSYNVTVQRELIGVRRTGRLRRIANRPPAPDDGAQLRAAWRWQHRQNPQSAVRPHGEHDLQLPYEDGTGRYDSLQATLTRRFSGGFQLQTSYVLEIDVLGHVVDGSIAVPPQSRAQFLRPSAQSADRVGGGTAVRRGKPLATEGLAKLLFGGWQLNGIFSSYSGTPFTVTASGTSLNAPGNRRPRIRCCRR